MVARTGGFTQVSLGTIGTWPVLTLGTYAETVPAMRLVGTNGHRVGFDSYALPDAGIRHMSPLPIVCIWDTLLERPVIGTVSVITITYPGGATLVGTGVVTTVETPTPAHNTLMLWPMVVQFQEPPTYTPAVP